MSFTPSQRDKKRLENDIAFGLEMEPPIIRALERHFGKPIERTTGNPYEKYDGESEDRMFEIKCRDMGLNTYKETMIGINKSKAKKSGKPLYFVFCYYNGVYCCEYKEEVFEDYRVENVMAVRRNGNRYALPNYYIPVCDLECVPITAEERAELDAIRLKYGKHSRELPRGRCLL